MIRVGLLENPVWITEDEAGAVTSRRRLADNRRVSLDAVMNRLGFDVQRRIGTRTARNPKASGSTQSPQ
jgi:hypothetical protein